jgi:alpha-tubulin suppressor-like RCC1 family protein
MILTPAVELNNGPLRRMSRPQQGGRMHTRSCVTGALLLAMLGCGDEAESPTAPEPGSELATTATTLAFLQVSAGGYHTCGITLDNKAYCWGLNVWGELGDGTTTERLAPVPVAGGLSFTQISAGIDYTCGVDRHKQT